MFSQVSVQGEEGGGRRVYLVLSCSGSGHPVLVLPGAWGYPDQSSGIRTEVGRAGVQGDT